MKLLVQRIVIIGLLIAAIASIATCFYVYSETHRTERNIAAGKDMAVAQKSLEIQCALAGKHALECHISRPDSPDTTEHTKADLKAQQDVAEWTFLSVVVSLLSLVATLFGIFYVAKTLKATHRSIEENDRIAKDQNRAYVHIEFADLKFGSSAAASPRIKMAVKNTGQTPAKWFALQYKIFYDAIAGCDQEFATINFSGLEFTRWSALPRDACITQYLSAPADQETIRRAFNSTHSALYLAGTVRYQTFFGEIFETQFYFVIRGPFRCIATTESGFHGEEPWAMARTMGVLQTYEQIQV